MRKFIPTIILSVILIAFVIKEHKEREALASVTDQFAPATYRGLLPAADCSGVDYTLTLNDSIVGTDTLFARLMVYIEGDSAGGDLTFDDSGRQQQITHGSNRGYRLTSDAGDPTVYFVIVNDSTLRLCDSTLTAQPSELSYDLVRINQ